MPLNTSEEALRSPSTGFDSGEWGRIKGEALQTRDCSDGRRQSTSETINAVKRARDEEQSLDVGPSSSKRIKTEVGEVETREQAKMTEV